MKLDDIQYTRVSPVQTIGPQAAVQKYREKQGLLNAAFEATGKLAEQKAEADQIRAHADHRQDMMNFQTWAAENPTATREQLREWGAINLNDPTVFDAIDTTEFDQRGEEAIPSHVWMVEGMRAVQEQSRHKNADRIASPVVRKAWVNHVRKIGDEALARTSVQAAAQAVEYEVARTEQDVATAVEQGDFERAGDLLQSPVFDNDPIKREILSNKVYRAAKWGDIERAILTATSLEDFDTILAQTSDEKWNADLSPSELLKMQGTIVSQRNARLTLEAKQDEERQDAIFIETLQAMNAGSLGMAELNARATALGPQYFASLSSVMRSAMKEGGTQSSVVSETDVAGKLFDLELGLYDGTHEDAVTKVKQDIRHEMRVGNLTADDAMKYMEKVRGAEAQPYATPAYKNLGRELRNRIMGTEEGGFSFLATKDSRHIYENAMNSLQAYVQENGGPAADLNVWKEQNMKGFLKEAAVKAMEGFPEEIKDIIVLDSDNNVDYTKTDQEIQDMMARELSRKEEYGAEWPAIQARVSGYAEKWEQFKSSYRTK